MDIPICLLSLAGSLELSLVIICENSLEMPVCTSWLYGS